MPEDYTSAFTQENELLTQATFDGVSDVILMIDASDFGLRLL